MNIVPVHVKIHASGYKIKSDSPLPHPLGFYVVNISGSMHKKLLEERVFLESDLLTSRIFVLRRENRILV